MGQPGKIVYRKGCLGLFIGGFFFVPAIWLLVLAFLSRSEEYCGRRAPPCLPHPDYLPFYLTLGILFLLGGVISAYVMLIRPRR